MSVDRIIHSLSFQRILFQKITFVSLVISLLIFGTYAFQISPVSAQIDNTDIASQTLSVNQSLPTNQTLSANQTAILGTLAQTLQTISTNQTELRQILNDSLKRQYLVHTVWQDDTSGDLDVNYRRAGGKFDPSGRIDLSTNVGDSAFPVVATQGRLGSSNVYVVWQDNTGLSGFNSDIWFKKSEDGGATWKDPIHIISSETSSMIPDIAAVGNNTYIVWQENTQVATSSYDIFFAMSTDNGDTFGAPINLSNNLGNSWSPTIAARGSNVHVMWSDDSLGPGEIVYRKSVDNGGTFGGTINISNSPLISRQPHLAVGSGTTSDSVYVVWTDIRDVQQGGGSQIRFIKSDDLGTTFGATKDITRCCGSGIGAPAIDVYWEDVYIVYESGFDIELAKSADGGNNFDFRGPHSMSNSPDSDSSPAVAAEGHEVYVAWTNSRDGASEILVIRSTDSGERWEHFTSNISNDRGSSAFPSIAIRAIYSVWGRY